MPAYLVELAENEKATLRDLKLGKLIVWATSAAQAKAVAKAAREEDSGAAWDAATVTDLSTVQNFSHLSLKLQVLDASPVIDIDVPMPSGKVVSAVAINNGGTGYSVNDILTIATGTKTRAATARVTSESGGVVDGIELVDPGDSYTVDPTTTGVATTGGGGSGCTLDLTLIENGYENILGAAVTALNATAIDNAAMDFGTGTGGTLTIAGAADSLGDKNAEAWFYVASDGTKTPIVGLLGTITDGGSAGSALTVLGVVSPVAGKLLAAM